MRSDFVRPAARSTGELMRPLQVQLESRRHNCKFNWGVDDATVSCNWGVDESAVSCNWGVDDAASEQRFMRE